MKKTVNYIDDIDIAKLKNGDEKAFEKLFEKYQQELFNYAYSLVKSKIFAQEIIQEVFVKVWVNRHNLKQGLSLKSYIYKITKNHACDFLVKASRNLKLQQDVFYKAEKAYNSVDNYILNKEYELILQKAIDKLPPKRKRIFVMSRLEGKSYKDISSELGITLQTVKNQMSTALDNITTYLKTEGEFTFAMVLLSLLN